MFIIYKTTNLINGRYYIGKHVGTLEDSYLGSGVGIMRAIKKYGKEQFKREILIVCSSNKLMNELERLYINEEIVQDKSSYNMILGGQGGMLFIKGSPEYDVWLVKLKSSKRRIISGKEHHSYGRPAVNWTPELRLKLSNSLKGHKAWNKGVPASEYVKEQSRLANLGNTRAKGGNRENTINANSLTWKITDKEGTELIIKNLAKFARERNLDVATLHRTLKNSNWHHKGYQVTEKVI